MAERGQGCGLSASTKDLGRQGSVPLQLLHDRPANTRVAAQVPDLRAHNPR